MTFFTAVLSAWFVLAQSRTAPAPTIDFVVTTADGASLTDLVAADVTIRIDGKNRPIRALQLIRLAEGSTPDAAFVPAPYGTNALTSDGRSLVLAIDQDSFRPGREQPFRSAIAGLLASLGPRDRVMLLTLPFGAVKAPFTTDHARVTRAVSTTSGQRPQNETGSDMACRTRRVLETTAGFLEALKYADAPTSLVFFTGGMAAPRRDAPATMSPGMCELPTELFARVARAAGSARANFYVVHPDDVGPPLASGPEAASTFAGSNNPLEGIETLTGVTGGRRMPLAATGTTALARVARESSSYYVAQIEPDPADYDGRDRQVNVRIARRGAQVHFRPLAAFTDSRRVLRLRTAAYSTKGPAGRIKVMALVEPVDPLTIVSRATAALIDEDNRVVAQWTAPDPSQVPLTGSLLVAPGSYRLRVTAEDKTGATGSAEYPVTAQLATAGPLQIGDLILGVSRDGMVVPKLEFGREPVALGSVAFHGQPTGQKLTIGLEVARSLDGPAIQKSPLAIERVGEEDYAATGAVPLASLPPGDYVVRAVIAVEGQAPTTIVRTLRKRAG